jgi:RecB family exonuclease
LFADLTLPKLPISDLELKKEVLLSLRREGLAANNCAKLMQALYNYYFQGESFQLDFIEHNLIKTLLNDNKFKYRKEIIESNLEKIALAGKKVFLCYEYDLDPIALKLYRKLINSGAGLIVHNLQDKALKQKLQADLNISLTSNSQGPRDKCLNLFKDDFENAFATVQKIIALKLAGLRNIAVACDESSFTTTLARLCEAHGLTVRIARYLPQSEFFKLQVLCFYGQENLTIYSLTAFMAAAKFADVLIDEVQVLFENSVCRDIAKLKAIMPSEVISLIDDFTKLDPYALFEKYFSDYKSYEFEELFTLCKSANFTLEEFRALCTTMAWETKKGDIDFISYEKALALSYEAIIVINYRIDQDNQALSLARLKAILSRENIFYHHTQSLDLSDQLLIESLFAESAVAGIANNFTHLSYLPCKRPVVNTSVDLLPQKLSVSAIEKLINNPYAFYLEYILKLKPLEFDTDALARFFGNLIHAGISNAMPKFSAAKFSAFCAAELQNAQLSEGVVRGLMHKIEKISHWLAENISPTSRKFSEVYGEYEYMGIKLNAKADLIEATGESLNIVDFKTGSAPKQAEVNCGASPQLAVEMFILAAGGFKNIPLPSNQFVAQYYEIKGKKEVGKIYNIKVDLKVVAQSLQELIEQFSAANFFATNKTPTRYQHIVREEEWQGANS